MSDRYDEAIEYLKERPTEIMAAWSERHGEQHPAHCLFQAATKDGFVDFETNRGCLTQIRGNLRPGPTPEITRAIRFDSRIPASSAAITLESLPVFAEWQRKLDAELGRS